MDLSTTTVTVMTETTLIVEWCPRLRAGLWLSKTLRLSKERLAGFLLTALILFPQQHFRIRSNSADVDLGSLLEEIRRNHLLVTSSESLQYNSWVESWPEFFTRLSGKSYAEAYRYTCIFSSCESSNLIQFNSFDFLVGSQILCDLFKLECRDQIRSLHDHQADFNAGVRLLCNSFEIDQQRRVLRVA